jgi:predicted flap endonuclease-1-like 5' DNA nuclease
VEKRPRLNRGCIFATGRARERRRRSFGASIARHAHGPLPDLLTVPGIGPRNMEKLVAKGIAKLAELKQLYRDKVSFQHFTFLK